MVKIQRNNILIFIGKMLLMIAFNIFSGFIMAVFDIWFIFLILCLLYFFCNFDALLITYTKETVVRLKNIDKISLIIFSIIFIIYLAFVLILESHEKVKADKHGSIFIFPLIALGLNVVYFFIAYIIDKVINSKISRE